MPWYNGGDWSYAGGQDLPYIIAELWTAINQRHRVLLLVDDPTLSQSEVEDELAPLPGTVDNYWPEASDLDGEPIHTPIYMQGIVGGIISLLNYGSGQRWLAPTTSEYRYYVQSLFTPLDTWPICNQRWLGDDVAVSNTFWLNDSAPFVFYLPAWNLYRQILDRLTHISVEFAGGYDPGTGWVDWDDDDEKTHLYRFGFTYPGMLNESFDQEEELRRDMNIFIGSQASTSEQRDECELGSYGYVVGHSETEIEQALTTFPFSSFVVNQCYVPVNQRARESNYPDPQEAEQIIDGMAAQIGSAVFSRTDLCEVPDPQDDLWFDTKRWVATGVEANESLNALIVRPRIDWESIPEGGEIDDDPVAMFSISNVFGAGYLPIGESDTGYANQLRVIRIKTDISIELDDQ